MVTFQHLGKLGFMCNQMFQIACTIGYSIKHNTNAIFPKWKYANYFKNMIDQSLSDSQIGYYFDESGFNYSEIPFHNNLSIYGYFQSEKYFNNCSDHIRHMFEPNDEIYNKIISKYSFVLEGSTCSIHVRRGDYVGSMHEVCGIDYFRNAMEEINSRTVVDRFLIFSDDIAWCTANFPEITTSSKFLIVQDNSDIEDLFLMSLCTHNIICNSTFSWWGSWLNKNPGKLILAPDKWFRDGANINSNDVYTDNMILVPTIKKLKIGLLVIATGKYDIFIQPLLESVKKYFFVGHDITMFVFTDSVNITDDFDIIKIVHRPHLPWPNPTLLRYHVFDDNKEMLSQMDYLFYCDADMRFVAPVSYEILPDNESGLVATLHPGFYNNNSGSFERNPYSTAFIDPREDKVYVAGGFNGGRSDSFLKMSEIIKQNIDIDKNNNIIAIWHDESHLNRYMTDHAPKLLSPSYCYPESWNIPFEKKLLALDKDHNTIRN